MLVKLAFAMQIINKDEGGGGGGHSYYVGDSYYEGGHRAQVGPPSPPLGKTLFCVVVMEFVM